MPIPDLRYGFSTASIPMYPVSVLSKLSCRDLDVICSVSSSSMSILHTTQPMGRRDDSFVASLAGTARIHSSGHLCRKYRYVNAKSERQDRGEIWFSTYCKVTRDVNKKLYPTYSNTAR